MVVLGCGFLHPETNQIASGEDIRQTGMAVLKGKDLRALVKSHSLASCEPGLFTRHSNLYCV